MTTISKLKLLNEIISKGEYYRLQLLKEDLEKELYQEANKEKGTTNTYKFATSFIKKLDKFQKQKFAGLEHDNEKYYLCDGYRAFEFSENIEGISQTNNGLKFSSLFEDAKNNAVFELHIDNKDLKFMCEQQKTIETIPLVKFNQNGKKYGFNGNYMLDVFKIIKNPKVYISDNTVAPFYIIGENNINAFLLPVRMPQSE